MKLGHRTAWFRTAMRLSPRSRSSATRAYTLVEVLISMFIVALMLTSLYAGFSSGFTIVKLSRENLRATQIMVQKTESIRIFKWSQVTNSSYLNTSFIDYYNPSGTNNNTSGATYQGFVSLVSPTAVGTDYQTNMRAITISLYWTNSVGNGNVIVRNRQMQTYVARYGMQDYIYK